MKNLKIPAQFRRLRKLKGIEVFFNPIDNHLPLTGSNHFGLHTAKRSLRSIYACLDVLSRVSGSSLGKNIIKISEKDKKEMASNIFRSANIDFNKAKGYYHLIHNLSYLVDHFYRSTAPLARYQIHPYVRLTLDLYRGSSSSFCESVPSSDPKTGKKFLRFNEETIKVYNERFLPILKKELNSKEVNKVKDRFRSPVFRKAEKTIEYIDNLQNKYKDVHVIALDLLPDREDEYLRISNPGLTRESDLIKLLLLREYFQSFYKIIKEGRKNAPPISEKLIGYAWRLDYGEFGWHYTFLLFFRSNRFDYFADRLTGHLVNLWTNIGSYSSINAMQGFPPGVSVIKQFILEDKWYKSEPLCELLAMFIFPDFYAQLDRSIELTPKLIKDAQKHSDDIMGLVDSATGAPLQLERLLPPTGNMLTFRSFGRGAIK